MFHFATSKAPSPGDLVHILRQSGEHQLGYTTLIPGSSSIWLGDMKSAFEGDFVSKEIAKGFLWPNRIRTIDYDVFDMEALVVPDGFFIPGTEDGGIYILDLDTYEVTKIHGKPGFYYNEAFFVDLDNDGLKDCIGARTNKPVGSTSELIWLKHPEGDWKQEWEE